MATIFGLPASALLGFLLAALGLIALVVLYTALRYPLPFRLGVRNLPRRKSQTGLIIAGLALSTLIITAALGIGDTVDYSAKAEVYDDLGRIDLQISANKIEPAAGFSITGDSSAPTAAGDPWFAAEEVAPAISLVDGENIDAAVPVIVQTLPAANERTGLSEPAVNVRGLGEIGGAGLAAVPGLAELAEGDVIVNRTLANALSLNVGETLLLIKGMPTPLRAAVIVPDGELAGTTPTLIMPLDRAQTLFAKPGQITALLVSLAGGVEDSIAGSEAAIASLQRAAPGLVVNPIKADQLEAAETSSETITTLFVTFSTFSIVSGILLIFLIFSVLAAERRSELGMSRAVGLQRADLVRQFVTEGLAYNFLASILGAFLGVLAALGLAGLVATLLSGSDLAISPRIAPRSVLIGWSLGLVITFITVSLSAVRTSKINIIAAIRDLNLPTPQRIPQWTLFIRPFTVWRAAIAKAGEGNLRAALRLFLFAGPKAVLNFWGGLFARGPILLTLGLLFAWAGVNVAGVSVVYALGVSLFIIGAGQLLHWLRLSARTAYTLTGIALILYWALPTREVGKLAELENSQGDFFLGGILLVGAAIVLFLYNADFLLNLFAGLLGRLGNLLPVARIAIAYPVSAKGRTATTLAMFSLIIFTLISTATIANTFGNFLDVTSGSGDYDLLVQTNPFNPVPAEQLAETVQTLVDEGDLTQPAAFANATFAPVQAQAPGMDAPAPYAINGVGEDFLASQRLELASIANTFASKDAVWAALASDPTLVVIDNFSVDRTGAPGYTVPEDSFYIGSITASDTVFEPVPIEIGGEPFTIVGVLASAPSFFGAMMNAEAAAGLGYEAPNRYFLRLPGADAADAARAIEGALPRSGLQISLLKEELEASRSSTNSIFYLLQGFIGLGLLIGIAALGVITIRAVVERRQQIGVLRAIGFQQGMVQNVFLLESLFIAGLGVLIGYSLALTFAYNLYQEVAADQGLPFLPPWATLIGIGLAIFVASLLTAWLPARTTARVTIAEALRYEG